MIKMTFTLDDETVRRLREIAARLDRPQSYVVREAIREYGTRGGKTSEAERARLLYLIDHVLLKGPTRPQKEADAELYRKVGRARQWTIDLAVAACAITHGAALWTLNPKDFRDIPGLALV